MSSKITVLIVDDEPTPRRWIRSLLADDPDVQVIGECGDGLRAVELINEWSPDLVFLDVQMPGMDGLEVVRKVGVEKMPIVVFVTAYDEYAVTAFEVNAQDYLLKPLDRDRFAAALRRAVREVGHRRSEKQSRARRGLAATTDPDLDLSDRILVRSAGRTTILKVSDIGWVESAGNYVTLHVRGESYLQRETMKGMEARLAPHGFVRIHRASLVNTSRLKQLVPKMHGDHVAVLSDGTKLAVSRRYRAQLEEELGRLK